MSIDSREVTFYTWFELQTGRGCVEIEAALLHRRRSLNFASLVEKLFSSVMVALVKIKANQLN